MKGKRQNFRSYDLAQRFFGPNPSWRRTEWAHQSVGVLVYVAYVGGLGIMISAAVETALNPLLHGSIATRVIWVILALFWVWRTARPIPKPHLLWAFWAIVTLVFALFRYRDLAQSNNFGTNVRAAGLVYTAAIISWSVVVVYWLRLTWKSSPDNVGQVQRLQPSEWAMFLTRLKNESA